MFGYFKKIIFLSAIFLTILFIMFVINQTSQLVLLAGTVSPLLGQVVLIALLLLYTAVIIIPLISLFSRPAALIPPAEADSQAYEVYLQKLLTRLKKNPHLNELTITKSDRTTLEIAQKKLNSIADEKIKETAANVFVMTAISQYGALDAVIVVLAQFRMIWQVASIYNQRPSIRELLYLYSNVFATAFLATRIENLEILEDQLEPVIASVMGSSLTSLTPAVNTAANIVTSAIIQGSANAFLTLRVGVIARQYCASLVKPERNAIRSAAIVQASTLLATVLKDSTYKVTRAILRATAKAGKRPFIYGQNLVASTTQKTWDTGKNTLQKSEELARKLGNKIKKSGKRVNFYFTRREEEKEKPEAEDS